MNITVTPSTNSYTHHLRYDGEPGPEVLQPERGHVPAVYADPPLAGLQDAEHGEAQTGLARPGPPHQPHLCSTVQYSTVQYSTVQYSTVQY